MPCYSPLRAFRTASGAVVFTERRTSDEVRRDLDLPCGRCIGCRLERSRQWAVRCVHEASMHKRNCFLTLTYAPEHLPPGGTLNYRHFQLFMKRYRKKHGDIRFFMCGEYGEDNNRPHYHACIFGHDFDDKVVLRRAAKSGDELYASADLDSLWRLGSCSIGVLNFESAAYCARYLMAKRLGHGAEAFYERVDLDTGELFHVEPEFAQMSRAPGIGATWLDKYHAEVYAFDSVISRGREAKPPRYYDKRFKERHDADRFDEIQAQRELDGAQKAGDNSRERLRVKEVVASARMKSFKRDL